jgi:hypothetical protein
MRKDGMMKNLANDIVMSLKQVITDLKNGKKLKATIVEFRIHKGDVFYILINDKNVPNTIAACKVSNIVNDKKSGRLVYFSAYNAISGKFIIMDFDREKNISTKIIKCIKFCENTIMINEKRYRRNIIK